MIIDRKTLVRKMLIDHMIESGLKYIDKTSQGGSLYFFDRDTAAELESKGYTVNYAEKGSRSTRNRPAWYVSYHDL